MYIYIWICPYMCKNKDLLLYIPTHGLISKMGFKQACRLNCIQDLCLSSKSLKEIFVFVFAHSFVFKLSVEHNWIIEPSQVIGRPAAVIHEKPAQDSRNPKFWVYLILSDVNATFFDPDGHWMEHVSMSLVVPNQITP